MQSSGELMKLMNGVMKTSVVAKTMMELSREMFKAGVMDEMVGDAMGSALDEEDMEEETEEEVQKILNELAVDSVKGARAPCSLLGLPEALTHPPVMPAAGRMRAPVAAAPAAEAAAEEEEEDGEALSGLQARLNAIRAS